MSSLEMQMAVFLVNNCKFSGCGLTFRTLQGLIRHIEECHIDSDPLLLEKQEMKQPGALALSYILKFFTEASTIKQEDINLLEQRTVSPTESLNSITPGGSEFDDDCDDVMTSSDDEDDSDDSAITAKEEFTSKFILRMVNIKEDPGNEDRPFCCPIPGCKKRYKNINGIKYHAKNGHKTDVNISSIPKFFQCHCGKTYKTAHGLKNHNIQRHPAITVHNHSKNGIITSQTVLVKRLPKSSQSIKHLIEPTQPFKSAKSILTTSINQDLLVDNLQRYDLPTVTIETESDIPVV